jgi:hypothetical protein
MFVKRLLIASLSPVLLFIAAAPTARPDAIDTLTLTPVGANTKFVITGRYPADLPATPYISPNTPYTLTFVLPTAPISFAFLDTADGIFALDTTITLNTFTFPDSQIAFFGSALGGGLDACLSEICSPDPPTAFDRWVIFGGQLFTGDVSAPVFISGTASIDPSQSFIETPVPEPASLTFAGFAIGITALALYRRRKGTA